MAATGTAQGAEMGPQAGLDRPSPLASQLEVKTRDLDWTLAHFSFVANVTTLAAECDIAHSPAMSVASCRALSRLGLAFVGDSSDLLATYATFLADPGSEVMLLVNEAQREIVERALAVQSIAPKWQLLYQGEPPKAEFGSVSELADNDLPAIQALARAEKVDLNAICGDLLKQGPAFGIWDRRKLVAAATTIVCLPGAAQVGNVITRKEYQRQGYGTAVLSTLLQAHMAQSLSVFAVVDQADAPLLEFFEAFGFKRERPMYEMACMLGSPTGFGE